LFFLIVGYQISKTKTPLKNSFSKKIPVAQKLSLPRRKPNIAIINSDKAFCLQTFFRFR